MRNLKTSRLHFSCTYNELVAKSIEKEAFLSRDHSDLAARGVTPVRIAALATFRDTFIAIPTGHTEKQTASAAFYTRDVKRLELMVQVDEVLGIAQNTFGKSSPQYKGFNIKGLSHFNADDLYKYSLNVVDKATENLTAMQPKGLTPAMLTNITTLRDELIILIAAPLVLVSDSVQITSTRTLAANLLFDEMHNMCQTGVVYYKSRNKVKMVDYHLSDITTTEVTRKGTVKTLSFKTPKTKDIVATTVFKIKVKTGVSLVIYFSMIKGTPPPTDALKVLMNPNIFTVVTADSLGYNLNEGVIYLNIYNPNQADSSFFIKMM